jgi:endo-1,4-beta-xylanase
MNNRHLRSLVKIVILLVVVAGMAAFMKKQEKVKGLKDYYKSYFPVGAAVTPQSLHGPDSLLIVQQFNSLTAENVMKMGPIHPEENKFNWEPADAIVNFALAHGMKMRGHTLCWHTQAPRWIFKDSAGNNVSKEILLQRLKKHITEVVSRYKGKIYAWDVVNEVIADGDTATTVFRNSPWYQICGEEYITKAFEYAHAIDPNAQLFYNDYNTEQPVKREKIYQMLKKLLEAKVPITGVGLQGHWNITDPLGKELQISIDKFASLGLKVQITELDISVYPPGRRTAADSTGAGFTPEREQLQLQQYKTVFDVLRKNKKKLNGITFWNVSDRRSWLDNRGRKNYPLLFDQENNPKKAYWEVVKF